MVIISGWTALGNAKVGEPLDAQLARRKHRFFDS
jgi:hypothetical protein